MLNHDRVSNIPTESVMNNSRHIEILSQMEFIRGRLPDRIDKSISVELSGRWTVLRRLVSIILLNCNNNVHASAQSIHHQNQWYQKNGSSMPRNAANKIQNPWHHGMHHAIRKRKQSPRKNMQRPHHSTMSSGRTWSGSSPIS